MKRLLAPLALALLIAACGLLPRKAAVPPKAPPPAAAPTAPAPAAKPLPAADIAYANGAAALEEGRPGRALDLFAEAWKEFPGHPGVGQNFAVALERLKKQGDEAGRQGKPEEAGRAWSASLSYLSHPAARGKTLPFTRADLQGSIDRLSKTLMDKGLMEYREGRFESAISWWQTILSYDPSNEEAAKSVRTATTQLENLRKIPPKK